MVIVRRMGVAGRRPSSLVSFSGHCWCRGQRGQVLLVRPKNWSHNFFELN
ncbi:hypothetical protein RchiOBHm_Chr6g0286341 [Rosa chinensis]|uniref:Uncharacterized protein n=1 Tax=Rosa chinensis TaxID=74649 RepID=A0A2P6PUS5_ROSCH|nr:hypothetical protein RchiOBHm_Chr6g0286341 [Rosa chinensis]